MAVWYRFELEDGFDDGRFVEITHEGCRVYVRSGRIGKDGRVERKELRSEEAAHNSVAKRMKTLTAKGYLRDDDVTRPLPEKAIEAAAKQRADVAAERKSRIERIPAAFVAYADEWTALGFAIDWPFRKTAARRKRPHAEIATLCVGLAEKHFDVPFTFRTVVDEEHGDTGNVWKRHYAEHYCCPLCVAAIAEQRVLHGGSIDGGSLRGCGGKPFSGMYDTPVRVIQGYERWKARRG